MWSIHKSHKHRWFGMFFKIQGSIQTFPSPFTLIVRCSLCFLCFSINMYDPIFVSSRQEKTVMKLVVDAETDKVLGASMCGPDAPEIMQVCAFWFISLMACVENTLHFLYIISLPKPPPPSSSFWSTFFWSRLLIHTLILVLWWFQRVLLLHWSVEQPSNNLTAL